MQTTPATPEQIREWQRLYALHRDSLRPNRRSGTEVDAYFRSQYPYTVLDHRLFAETVRDNILHNPASAEKLPAGILPDIVTYLTDGIYVGIDLVTGCFQVECADIARMASVWDDLFIYRGLDETDLQNFYLTAEYIRLCGIDK